MRAAAVKRVRAAAVMRVRAAAVMTTVMQWVAGEGLVNPAEGEAPAGGGAESRAEDILLGAAGGGAKLQGEVEAAAGGGAQEPVQAAAGAEATGVVELLGMPLHTIGRKWQKV